MAKAAPAFQFYPDAFDGGTARMTLSEVGGYMRLLNEQWVSGSIPGDDHAALSRVMRCAPATARSVWKVVGAKFVRHAENDWRNERLEKERSKQDARRAALAANGQSGAEKRWANHDKPIANAIAGPMAMPMANEKQTNSLPSLDSGHKENTPPKSSLREDLPASDETRVTRRRRRGNGTPAEQEHVRKSQEVKRLEAQGVPRPEAMRRAGYQ